MTNKEIIIIVLLIVVIYLYYQQSKRNVSLLTTSNQDKEQIRDLQQEVQHYQTLYQKRVAKDLDAERLQTELQGWENRYKDLEKLNSQQVKQIQALTLLANQRKEDLSREKQALFKLAHQKIKGKKEFQALVKQLESSWQQDKQNWEQERQSLLLDLQSKDNERQLLTTQQAQQLQVLESSLKDKEELITNYQQEKNDLVHEHQQEKQKWQTDYQVVQEKLKELTATHQKELEAKVKNYQQLEQDLKKENQEKLRKINLLFDEQAKDYEKIEFEGLYSLLENVWQKLNKPSQENSTQTESDKETEQTLDELLTNIRKLNSEL